MNDASAVPGTHLALFADDAYIYVTEKHERRVLCKLQRGLTAVISRCERWDIKINEGKTQAICFCRRHTVPDELLQLNEPDIPLVNNVRYFGVTFDSMMTWRRHIGRTVAKALCKYVRTYPIFKSGCLKRNIKFTVYTALIRSVMTYACPSWAYAPDSYLLKLQSLQNRALRAI
jgi:hypothetical protein